MTTMLPNPTPMSVDDMTDTLELIRGLDRKLLTDAVTAYWVRAGLETPDDVRAWLDGLVDHLATVPADHEPTTIVIGYPSCEQDFDDPHRMEMRMTSAAFHIDELPAYGPDLMRPECDPKAPPANGYAYEFCDWAEILSWKTWLPARTTDIERCEFAADLIWELTFFGDTYDEASKATREMNASLDESAADVERWVSEGTLSEHTHTLDDLRKSLNIPEPDPRERELEHVLMNRMWRLNALFLEDLMTDIRDLTAMLGM